MWNSGNGQIVHQKDSQVECADGYMQHTFLSPDWIRTFVHKLECAQESDAHFKGLVEDLSLTVVYTINDIPESVGLWYGCRQRVFITVRLDGGIVHSVRVGGAPCRDEFHLGVSLSYDTAKQLLKGELSPARTVVNRSVKVRPVSGFSEWPRIATRSVITASKVLRVARNLLTEFEPDLDECAARAQ